MSVKFRSIFCAAAAAVLAAFPLSGCSAEPTASAEPTPTASGASETTTAAPEEDADLCFTTHGFVINTTAEDEGEFTQVPFTEPTDFTDSDNIAETEITTYIYPDSETDPATIPTSESTVPSVSVTTVPSSASSVLFSSEPQISSVDGEETVYKYEKAFFDNSLFIGDSISTGLSLYKYLDSKNVYAKVGLNSQTVLTKKVSTVYGNIGITDMVTYTSPEYVCIMLGSNGIQFISIDKLINCTDTLVKTILELAPDAEIVILSVPPVTPGYDATVPNMDVQHQMDCYNASLEGYCRQGGYTYVDIATPLKDDTGYFDPDYAANDGMHFKAEAYRIMLDTVYTKLYNEKLEKLKNGELTETETETQISETEITDASVTEVLESETVPSETTVPESVTVTETSETTVPASSVTTPETSKTTAPAKEKTPAATTAPKTKPAETTVPGTSSDSGKTEQTTGKPSKKKKKKSTVTTAAEETSAAQTETSKAKKKKSK